MGFHTEMLPIKFSNSWHFHGGSVVKISPSSAEGTSLNPGWGAKISHASWPKHQNIKEKHCCIKFNEDFKNDPPPKKNLKKIFLPTIIHDGLLFLYYMDLFFQRHAANKMNDSKIPTVSGFSFLNGYL